MTTFIQWVSTQFNSNPVFVGGVSTVLLSALMYTARSIPWRIIVGLKHLLTLELIVTSDKEGFDCIDRYISKYRLSLFSRTYSAEGTKLELGFGFSFALYKGHPVFISKQLSESQWGFKYTITMVFISKRPSFIAEFVQAANNAAKNTDYLRIQYRRFAHDNTTIIKPKRAWDTIFVEDALKTFICERINWFIQNEAWYVTRGIPYKLCILFHGVPGTGKTSLIHAICSMLEHRKVIYTANFDLLNNTSVLAPLSYADDGEEESYTYVIEDIDTLLCNAKRDLPPDGVAPKKLRQLRDTQKAESSTSQLTLHDLLNSLDGFTSQHGAIVLMTTNSIASLDTALVRKGRIDICLEIPPMSEEVFRKMCLTFYGVSVEAEVSAFLSQHNYAPLTGAVVQDIFMRNASLQESLDEIKNMESV